MTASWKLFAVRGIDIRLHFTFPLILLWAGLQFAAFGGGAAGFAFGALATLLLFGLVLLHELGHALAAQRYQVPVKQIVLMPLGGVAQLGRLPEKPTQELVIALAGPAVNVLLALPLGALAWLGGPGLTDSAAVLLGGAGFSPGALFAYLFVYNGLLAAFNMLPAFPLDGGRVLRALLALRLDYTRATVIAASLGQILAGLLGLFGLLTGQILTVVVALFIFIAAGAESRLTRLRAILRGRKVHDIYARSVYSLQPFSTLQQALNLMLFSGQRSFPVVTDGALVGYLPQKELMAAVGNGLSAQRPVAEVMRRDLAPARPADELNEVRERLELEQLDALPVAAGGRFLGLITWRQISDLQRLLATSPPLAAAGRAA
ncbi:MAG: site-2 protease family protein [Candidatus Promineifilaceae bacterium]